MALAAALAILGSGCRREALPPPRVSSPTGPDAAGPRAPEPDPPPRPLEARLTRATELYTEARGDERRCPLAPQPVLVLRFEAGRYAVVPTQPCDGPKGEGWVAAAALEYDARALGPELEEVTSAPGLRVAMAYAGDAILCTAGDCLIREPLYGKARCFLRPEAAARVREAARRLASESRGLRLVLQDCYRPFSVQVRMFERVGPSPYVSHPRTGFAGHTRGVAVDITFETLAGGAVDMGWGYDELSPRSAVDAPVGDEARRRRLLLRQLLTAVGFSPYDAEWWHFALDVAPAKLNVPL